MKSLVLLVGILAIPSILAELEGCYVAAKGNLRFPENFSFGVGTSAYQIEGAVNDDGRGTSEWDDAIKNNPGLIRDGSNGNITANSYYQFDDDLKILKELKVGHYRFSISWSRIFPNGEVTYKNQAGVDYYNDVINKLIANGIKPMVTIYHMDLPLPMAKRGGFVSSLIIQYYVDFATELFAMFGDRVKDWITFNEPLTMCNFGYGEKYIPPFLNDSGVGNYLCAHNILKAHGAAYRVYKEKFFQTQQGKVGIALDTNFRTVRNPADQHIAERTLQFDLGILGHPIFSKAGGYPEVMVNDIARNSREEGRFMSRLPHFDEHWKNIIRGSADFLGLNYYRSLNLKPASGPPSSLYEKDLNYANDGEEADCSPSGLESILHWLRKEYNNVPMIILENGWGDKGEIEDDDRLVFLKSHLQAVLNALNEGCNVYGYTHWSLMDNFEWLNGFSRRFGLYGVNLTSTKRERYPKKSAHFYRKVISARISPNLISG